MIKLDNILYKINLLEQQSTQYGLLQRIDTRAKLLSIIIFLVFMLSVPIYDLEKIILFIIFPIILCYLSNINYWEITKSSFIILPFIAFIGAFNPIFDTQPFYKIGNITISAGWISFISIILRGLIATQSIFILIASTGFYNICHAMSRLGMPAIFSTQLLLVYHYIFILLQEALNMHRARLSRSFGKKNYPLKDWAIFIGQLFIRAIAHSQASYNAMLSRGFNGKINTSNSSSWTHYDSIFLISSLLLILLLRFINPNNIL